MPANKVLWLQNLADSTPDFIGFKKLWLQLKIRAFLEK